METMNRNDFFFQLQRASLIRKHVSRKTHSVVLWIFCFIWHLWGRLWK